jgi:hypothetical protein
MRVWCSGDAIATAVAFRLNIGACVSSTSRQGPSHLLLRLPPPLLAVSLSPDFPYLF